MRNLFCLSCVFVFLVAGELRAADPLGGMQLLEGYEHAPLQGFDSIVGEIKKEGGLRITYEIGAVPKPGAPLFGGSFSDRPKRTPKQLLRWYKEQTINDQPVHLAYGKDNTLQVSYPNKGMNLAVTVKTADEMADALLMILSYPNPVEKDDKPAK